MAFKYFLLFKTAQSEFRAWNELAPAIRTNIFPIVELTRGRKNPKAGKGVAAEQWSTTKGVYDFPKNVAKVREAFRDSERLIFDLTREEELSCFEIDNLSTSKNGYEEWVRFVREEKDNFNDLIPTLVINPSEGESEERYKTNITKQLEEIMAEFSGASYRTSILIDPDFLYDLIVLRDAINSHIEAGKQFWIILDHEFIRPGTGILHAARTLGLIDNIVDLLPQAKIVILATSFPRSVEDLGDSENDSFPIEEVSLFEEIAKNTKKGIEIFYGDYGSINPVRNDQVIARGGWRPRIDFPTSKLRTYYFREKRKEIMPKIYSSYASHYVSVAQKVINHSLFEDLPESWGVKQIKKAANGAPPGNAPSFWISVRMEIHILQQIRRLMLG